MYISDVYRCFCFPDVSRRRNGTSCSSMVWVWLLLYGRHRSVHLWSAIPLLFGGHENVGGYRPKR